MNLWFIFFLLLPQSSNSESNASPQISPAPFLISDSYRPGRWFPFPFTLKSESDWEGEIEVQAWEKGPVSTKKVQLKAGQAQEELIPIFLGREVAQVAVQAEENIVRLAPPTLRDAPSLLLIAEASDLRALQSLLAADSFAREYPVSVENAKILQPKNLSLDLYLLDATDCIAIHENAIASLPVGGKEMLLRWAVTRGRLLCTETGKKNFEGSLSFSDVVEVFGNKDARNWPLAHLPPQAISAKTSDFADWYNFPALILFAYLGIVVFWVFRKNEPKALSKLSLFAGIFALLEAVPGISWPNKTPAWRVAIVSEQSGGVCLEDHFQATVQPMRIKVNEFVLMPSQNSFFRFQHGSESTFSSMKGEWKLYSAVANEGRNLSYAAGSQLRNNLADLNELAWGMGKSGAIAYQESLAWKDLLAFNTASAQRQLKLRKPLSDFLAAKWVFGDWLIARIDGENPFQVYRPMDLSIRESFLIWFPNSH